jgi:hypothetical protein
MAISQMSCLYSAPTVDFGNAVVMVFAGSEQIKFVLHGDLVFTCSRFFEKVLQGEFNEGHLKERKLPETDSDICVVFLRRLYNTDTDEREIFRIKSEHPNLVRLYIYFIANNLMIRKLQTFVVLKLDRIFSDISASLPSRDFIANLYEMDAGNYCRHTRE